MPSRETNGRGTSFGLRAETLSPMETLAQSVSTMAPSTTPVATIPLVAALSGNGTWLAYVLATVAIFLVAWCVSRFAKYSASPGSLYVYASKTLPRPAGAVAAWSLLLAYIATGSSVIGGFYHYANILLHDAGAHAVSAMILALLVTLVSVAVAWRDVKISARLMLWIEVGSLAAILAVVTLVLFRHGAHLDWEQARLRGMSWSGLRLGLVLALFSYVGFESATTLGAEARNPLEIGILIDIGALVSLFACTLASITAAARVLLLMAHNGLAHRSLCNTHVQNATPTVAILVSGVAAVLPVTVLAWRGSSGLDLYGWFGALATYGFIVTYALVSVSLPRYLRDLGVFHAGSQIIPALAFTAMLLALVGNLYPVPEGPYGKLPYIYLVYLAAGMAWFFAGTRQARSVETQPET